MSCISHVMHTYWAVSSQRQLHLQANSAEQQDAAAEQEGDWQAGAPTVFQPFEASSPENSIGHHINVVLKPGASQVLYFLSLRVLPR